MSEFEFQTKAVLRLEGLVIWSMYLYICNYFICEILCNIIDNLLQFKRSYFFYKKKKEE